MSTQYQKENSDNIYKSLFQKQNSNTPSVSNSGQIIPSKIASSASAKKSLLKSQSLKPPPKQKVGFRSLSKCPSNASQTTSKRCLTGIKKAPLVRMRTYSATVKQPLNRSFVKKNTFIADNKKVSIVIRYKAPSNLLAKSVPRDDELERLIKVKNEIDFIIKSRLDSVKTNNLSESAHYPTVYQGTNEMLEDKRKHYPNFNGESKTDIILVDLEEIKDSHNNNSESSLKINHALNYIIGENQMLRKLNQKEFEISSQRNNVDQNHPTNERNGIKDTIPSKQSNYNCKNKNNNDNDEENSFDQVNMYYMKTCPNYIEKKEKSYENLDNVFMNQNKSIKPSEQTTTLKSNKVVYHNQREPVKIEEGQYRFNSLENTNKANNQLSNEYNIKPNSQLLTVQSVKKDDCNNMHCNRNNQIAQRQKGNEDPYDEDYYVNYDVGQKIDNEFEEEIDYDVNQQRQTQYNRQGQPQLNKQGQIQYNQQLHQQQNQNRPLQQRQVENYRDARLQNNHSEDFEVIPQRNQHVRSLQNQERYKEANVKNKGRKRNIVEAEEEYFGGSVGEEEKANPNYNSNYTNRNTMNLDDGNKNPYTINQDNNNQNIKCKTNKQRYDNINNNEQAYITKNTVGNRTNKIDINIRIDKTIEFTIKAYPKIQRSQDVFNSVNFTKIIDWINRTERKNINNSKCQSEIKEKSSHFKSATCSEDISKKKHSRLYLLKQIQDQINIHTLNNTINAINRNNKMTNPVYIYNTNSNYNSSTVPTEPIYNSTTVPTESTYRSKRTQTNNIQTIREINDYRSSFEAYKPKTRGRQFTMFEDDIKTNPNTERIYCDKKEGLINSKPIYLSKVKEDISKFIDKRSFAKYSHSTQKPESQLSLYNKNNYFFTSYQKNKFD